MSDIYFPFDCKFGKVYGVMLWINWAITLS